MGRNIYFTDEEIKQLVHMVEEATSILGEAEDTYESVDEALENGLGSAMNKLTKYTNRNRVYSEYKTKRSKVKWSRCK